MATWKIKDLKGVGDVELELDDSKRVFVFLGSNGVGKTKTLEAIAIPLITFVKKAHIQMFSQIENYDLFKSISFSDSNTIKKIESKNLIPDASHLYHYEPTVIEFTDKFESIVFINTQHNTDLENHKLTGIHDLISSQNKDIRSWIINKAQSTNPYEKKSLKNKNEIECFLESLKKIDNRFDHWLSIDEGNIYVSIDGKELELSELSSGFASIVNMVQSIISVYAKNNETEDILQVKGVVLIDEIENHMHLEWQTKIIPTLKNLFPNTTFYIATHSPLILSQLSQGEAYLLKRDQDGVVRSEKIKNPSGRLFSTLLNDVFGINLNQLKRENMQFSDQSEAKKKLLALLNETGK